MVVKRILCPDRLRRVPRQFSWVDHRLVRERRICGLSHQALALYLFLLTVGDAEGLSFYSDGALERYLDMDGPAAGKARAELCAAGLIAYSRPLYQVLSLDARNNAALPAVPCENPAPRGCSEPISLGQILRQAIGGGS